MKCNHDTIVLVEGKRYPLRYGSAAIEKCGICPCWRINCHGPSEWRYDDMDEVIKKTQDDKDEL